MNQVPFKNAKNNSGFSLIEVLILVAVVALFFLPVIALLYTFATDKIVSRLDYPVESNTEYVTDGRLKTSHYKLGFDKTSLEHTIRDSGDCGASITAQIYNSSTTAFLTPVDSVVYVTKDEIGISTSTIVTSIKSISDRLYLSLNSSSTTEPDILVLDKEMRTLYSYDTGPGIMALVPVNGYLIAINSGVTYQYLVFSVGQSDGSIREIARRFFPYGSGSSTPLSKIAVAFDDLLFVGTEKSIYPEVSVYNIKTGDVVAWAELGYGVNDMSIYDSTLFVLGPSNPEVQYLDIRNVTYNQNPQHQALLNTGSFDLVGGSGNAKVSRIFGNQMYIGRTKGNKELLLFDVMSDSVSTSTYALGTDAGSTKSINYFLKEKESFKVGWSIDSIQISNPYVYAFTSNQSEDLQIFTSNPLARITSIDLPDRVTQSLCYKHNLYMTFGKESAYALGIVKLKQ